MIYFLNEGCTPTTLLNFGITGPKFTKFTYNSQIITIGPVKIRMDILQSVSEFQGYELR